MTDLLTTLADNLATDDTRARALANKKILSCLIDLLIEQGVLDRDSVQSMIESASSTWSARFIEETDEALKNLTEEEKVGGEEYREKFMALVKDSFDTFTLK